mgnify:CR=1 FL=1
MKNLVLAGAIFLGIIVLSSLEYKAQVSENVNNIPDSVYEYIYLQLGDGASDSQIVEYYNNHRATCDSIEIANLY